MCKKVGDEMAFKRNQYFELRDKISLTKKAQKLN